MTDSAKTVEEQQAEWLEQYWDVLASDPAAPPPPSLDPGLVGVTRRLVSDLTPPSAAPEALARLQPRIQAEAGRLVHNRTARPGRGLLPTLVRELPVTLGRLLPARPAVLRLAAVVALVAVLAGLVVSLPAPQPVSALELIHRAQASLDTPASAGVHSYRLVMSTYGPAPQTSGGSEIRSQSTRWFQAPGEWRSQETTRLFDAFGTLLRTYTDISGNDGTDTWQWDPQMNRLMIGRDAPWAGASPFAPTGMDLSEILDRAGRCSGLTARSGEPVAGRPVWVIDPGPSGCPEGEREVLWLDQQTAFVLKYERYGPDGQQVIGGGEATEAAYNLALDPATFTFMPPPGSLIVDSRPSPAPSAEEFRRQAGQMSQEAGLAFFAPRVVPNGLVARRPRWDGLAGAERRLRLEYVPADGVEMGTSALEHGLVILEARSTAELLDAWTRDAQPIVVAGGTAWLRPGVARAASPDTSRAVVLVRGDTLVEVGSLWLSPDDLAKVATSLQPIP